MIELFSRLSAVSVRLLVLYFVLRNEIFLIIHLTTFLTYIFQLFQSTPMPANERYLDLDC